jgi:hypothetical protein
MGNSLGIDLAGKTLVIKAIYLKPEYRDLPHRLFKARGGFGCSPDTMGNAVIGTFLYDNSDDRMEGFMVERVATDDDLKALEQLYN